MRVALPVCVLALAAIATGAPAQQTLCTFEDAGAGTVRAVLDGRTFVLTDGREVRLAAIEVPNAGAGSRATLEHMLRSREVTLKRLGEDKDRTIV